MTEAISTECFASLFLLYGCVLSICFIKERDDDEFSLGGAQDLIKISFLVAVRA